MRIYEDLGFAVPDVLLPKTGVDPHQWAVIAVDQFTSEPEYWEQVEDIVGESPSTFHITLPEIYLGTTGEAERIHGIRNTMRQYLRAGILQVREGLILVERTMNGRTRRGLLACLDLERYDYTAGSNSLIRATEGTIVERLPSRMKIREGAALELPHIVVLIDDPGRTVIEPVAASKRRLRKLYDFELMLGSGRLAGFEVADESGVIGALRNLASAKTFAAKYGFTSDSPVLLFAMGDGNHSLATAKAVWEKMKSTVGTNHPARYALVEIENLHDEALAFEPIHRVLFNVGEGFVKALQEHFGDDLKYVPVPGAEEMAHRVNQHENENQRIGVVNGGLRFGVAEISNTTASHAAGTIQPFLDSFLSKGFAERIDYVHGDEVTVRLGSQPGTVGIFLPRISKSGLFKTVIENGVFPRKTFSMGDAKGKRFYMEARKIS
ncbi:MAG TPA: DUF1015 domain-containing protein [Terriglobia bacterium]|nr:DUF1015 domain-containing protein [Terriglobia bacterium]